MLVQGLLEWLWPASGRAAFLAIAGLVEGATVQLTTNLRGNPMLFPDFLHRPNLDSDWMHACFSIDCPNQ
jgi:hypothetical protein